MKLIYIFIFTFSALSVKGQEAIIRFDFDSYQLSSESKQQLSTFDHNNFSQKDSIKLLGFADTTGNKTYNYWLALHRAEAVQNYITKHTSFPPEQFIIESKGESNSIDHSKEYRIVKLSVKKHIEPEEKQTSPEEEILTKKENKTDKIVPEKIIKDTNALVADNFKKGKMLRLENIHFYPGTSVLLDQKAVDELNHLLHILRDNPTITIDVQGHVCCANNYMLSQERAIAIANYLVKNGISSNRITYSAYSNSRPLVPEVDDESRQKNRRVEILVTGN